MSRDTAQSSACSQSFISSCNTQISSKHIVWRACYCYCKIFVTNLHVSILVLFMSCGKMDWLTMERQWELACKVTTFNRHALQPYDSSEISKHSARSLSFFLILEVMHCILRILNFDPSLFHLATMELKITDFSTRYYPLSRSHFLKLFSDRPDMYSSPNIERVTKTRSMRWTGT